MSALEVMNKVKSSPIVRPNMKKLCIEASKKHYVKTDAVLKCFQKMYNPIKPPIATRKYTYQFERYMAVLISQLSQQGNIFSLQKVLNMFTRATPSNLAKPSYHWIKGWLKRHSDLVKLSDLKIVEGKRVAKDLRERCRLFAEFLDEYSKMFSLQEDLVVNVDETRIDMDPYGKKVSVVTSASMKSATMKKITKPQTRSMLTFCRAAGTMLLNVIVAKTSITKKEEKSHKITVNNN